MPGLGTKLAREIGRTQASEWLAGPALPAIAEDEVHVWKVDLSAPVTDVRLLLRDEHERAARFHFERDRQHFKIARIALRSILGRYLNLPPESLEFGQTEYGKPFLTNAEAAGLLFNLSHSGEVAVIAVAREREVGVDVEFMRADFATFEVAEHFFSVAEIYTLSGLDSHLRTQAFFNCWTRKEAYVKARGEGLSMLLDIFDVSLAPDVPAAMLNNRVDMSEPSRWIFQDLQVASGYAGALVIEALRSQPRLSHFQFNLPSASGSGSG
jgi:4'-phosphopantetheinyl transferase